MAESPHLGLPFLEAGQAQKHVTHNEALRILDALVQLSVAAVTASPPGSPEEGERHIVAEDATGPFDAKDNQVAVFEDGGWRFLQPRKGWRAWSEEAETLLIWSGTEWVSLAGGGGGGFDPDDVEYIFLNDAAPSDPNVKLAMRGEAALLHAIPSAESGSGDVRLQISKEGVSDTASVYFSTNFSGRAEFGLAGSDNFKLKVSPDGSSWTEALDIDKTTGRVRLPAALALSDADQVAAKRHLRERLTANRTYYVRTDGSNGNDGLANTSGGAFLTLQKAWDTIVTLDLNGFAAIVQIADGTYTSGLATAIAPVGGNVTFQGNNTTPANVVISTTSADCFYNTANLPGRLTLKDMKLQAATSGSGIRNEGCCTIAFQNINFGACATAHLWTNTAGATILATGNYAITGGSSAHARAGVASTISVNSAAGTSTITLSGTFSFGTAFAWAINGVCVFEGVTFDTTAATVTGTRWAFNFFGVVYSTNTLPGSSNGTAVSGSIAATGGGMKV
jgi:hypothetical protein